MSLAVGMLLGDFGAARTTRQKRRVVRNSSRWLDALPENEPRSAERPN